MIKVAYCNVENLDLNRAYHLAPKDRREKIDFYRFEKDKKLSAGAFLLLRKLLKEQNIANFEMKNGKYDKPYLTNCKNIYFNLSHSGKMVLCAISDREIGADIEYNDPEIDLNIAENFFFNREYESIMNSENPSDEFFKYWVLKESYMKYTGLGMNLKLDAFEIFIEDEIRLNDDDYNYDNHDKNLKFNLFEIEDYKIGIASHYDVPNLIEYSVKEIY